MHFSFALLDALLISVSSLALVTGTNVRSVPSCSFGQSVPLVLSIQSERFAVKVGDEINITCTACGNKGTFWFKDGKRRSETHRVRWISPKKSTVNSNFVEGKLNIRRVTKKDGGIYTCYAVDFVWNRVQKSDIKLVVKPRHHRATSNETSVGRR